MSELSLLRAESSQDAASLKFDDLKNRLEQNLESARQLPDLELLIRYVNDLAKDGRLSPDERNDLRRLRQRAYDRKRGMKSVAHILPPINETVSASQAPSTLEMELPAMQLTDPDTGAPMTAPPAHEVAPDFMAGIRKAIRKLDGERFACKLPGLLLLLSATILVSWLIWLQSVDLYESSGFTQPHLVATGGIVMIIGFACYYSISRTKLALLLCIYASTYEAYFMVYGTMQDEKISATTRISGDPELVFLREKAEKAKEAYLQVKARYDDPKSEVFRNGWFKAKHIDPIWTKNEEGQQRYLEKLDQLHRTTENKHVTLLKVLYRLGLVLLCMVFTHVTVAQPTRRKAFA